ncbi:hypothetical protein [Methylobacterium nodulans]|nr:hypothetical protein [Methylobacterium nodulans]
MIGLGERTWPRTFGIPAKRLALQVAQQLPLDRSEALQVLCVVRQLVYERDYARCPHHRPGRALPPQAVVTVEYKPDPDLAELAQQIMPQMPDELDESLEVLRHARVIVNYLTRDDMKAIIPPFETGLRGPAVLGLAGA